jgi:hypothetical protein
MRTIDVNVADQTYGNPPVTVNSLAIPLDDDVLVPVADQATPRAGNDVGSMTGPRPAEVIVGQQAPAMPSQNFGQILGVAPLFLPFPPSKADPNIQGQSLTAGNPPEFTVAGPDISIQTNQTGDTERDFTVTAVIDPDTGKPPPFVPVAVTGGFSSAWSAGPSVTTLASPAPLTGLASGNTVTIQGTPAAYNSTRPAGNVISRDGTFQIAANPLTGKTTLGSSASLPLNLTAAKRVAISGSAVPAYNGNHAISGVVSVSGGFVAVYDNSGVLPGTIVVVASAPTGLHDNQLVSFSGSTGYDGFHTVVAGSVVDVDGSFSSASDGGAGKVTIHVVGSTTGLVDGQLVTIAGSTNYNGTYAITNVTANTFKITPLGGFVGTDTGNWSTYTFVVDGTYGVTSTGAWASNTFDIDVAFAGSASGSWAVYTFEIGVAFAGTASGTWTYQPPPVGGLPATRYKLFVAPADLASFGVTMLGREIVFDDPILTIANEGASRLVTAFAANYVVIDRTDKEDTTVPVLANPQAGDTFTLYVQREGSEVVSALQATTVDVNVSTSTQPIQGAKNVFV